MHNVKGSIQREGLTAVNVYAPNKGTPKCIKQMLTDRKGETDSNPMIVLDFNTPLTTMDRSSIQTKKALALKGTLDSVNLMDIIKHSILKQESTHSP